jgi:transcriptional regulator with XRE-family HTH domain
MNMANQEIKKEIGSRLKQARSALGMTQKEFCARYGIKIPSLRDYELGNSIPGGEAISDLMRAGINSNWLLTGEGEMLLADHQAKLERTSKEVFGDAPTRLAQNPNADFEAILRRVAEASQATVRVSKEFDFALPVEWTSLIQELMAMHGLSEAGAKKVIEALKRQT